MPDLQTELQRWTRENDVGYVWRSHQGTHDGTYREKFDYYVEYRARKAFNDFCSATEDWALYGQYECEPGDTGPTREELEYWNNLQDSLKRSEEDSEGAI